MNHLSLWKNNPWNFVDLFDDIAAPVATRAEPRFTPACDIEETENQFVLSFDVPGISKDDIQIEVENQRLIVTGERRADREKKGEGHLFRERSYGKFRREFTLPESIDSQKIEAHHQDGVLRIRVPKAEVARARRIPVLSGSSAPQVA